VAVFVNGRDKTTLEATASELAKATGSAITPVVGDLNTEEGREALITACPDPDILVNNNGGPPPKPFEATDRSDWQGALEANLLAPLFLIQAVLPGMRERHFGRIVNVTSAMVRSPMAVMSLSTTARTGLTALSKGLSRDVARDNVTINALLPERFDTDRQLQMANIVMKMRGISYEEARAEQAASIAAGRLGDPAEFGDACAFLCSAQAGFITGQNISLDGGSYEGIF
jgi:3-oxoacyl-[acyl-carrier protein] reductase